METIRNLWHGRAGLAKTYWVYGILGGALWGIPLALVAPGSVMAIMLVLAFIAYCIFVNTGIWRAANQYHGQAAWATLAKIVAAVSYAFMILVVFGFIVAAWEAIGKPTLQATPTALDNRQVDSSSPSDAVPPEFKPVHGKLDGEGKTCTEITEFLGECKRQP